MSDMTNTTHSSDEGDSDIPVLTDIIDEERIVALPKAGWPAATDRTDSARPESITEAPFTGTHVVEEAIELRAAASPPSLEQMEAELSSRLSAELALQIPVLLEAALREHLPKAIGAKLQAELVSALVNALPSAAQNAAAELSSTLAFEVGSLLEQRLEAEVRRAVADEMARLSKDHQSSY